MPLKRLAALACVAALVPALAACGGGGSAGDSAGSSGLETVKIGLINPTGAYVSAPDITASMQAAVAGINRRGGLAGHKVELDVCNDRADPTLAAKCARQMVTDKVVAMAGQIGINDQAAQPILEAAGIPAVLSRGNSAIVLNSPNNYLLSAGTSLSYAAAGAYFNKKLGLPFAMVESDAPALQGIRSSLLDRFKAAGASPVNEVMANPQQADFAPIVGAARSQGAKAVVTILPSQQVGTFSAAAKSAGGPFQGISSNSLVRPSDVASFGGPEAVDRMVSVVSTPPLSATDKEAVRLYTEDLKAEFASGDKDADPAEQAGVGFTNWLCLIAIQEALQQTKTTDVSPAGIHKAMRAAKNLQLGGAVPPWTPNAPGLPSLGRVSNDAYFLVGYKNAQQYLIFPNAIHVADALAGKF